MLAFICAFAYCPISSSIHNEGYIYMVIPIESEDLPKLAKSSLCINELLVIVTACLLLLGCLEASHA